MLLSCTRWSLTLQLAFPLLLSCGFAAECPREGCDALNHRASMDGTGIAGVGAAASDVVSNGCAECPFSNVGLDVWATNSPVTSKEQALTVVDAALPAFSLSATPRYAQPLEPGSYLVCRRPSCVAVQVSSGVTTVNVRITEGPPLFFVAEPPASTPVSTFGFDVGFGTQ